MLHAETNVLADEIERDYIPRPRFEDDAPLQWGERVNGYDKPIDGIKLFDDGSGRVGNHRDDDLYWIPFSILKTSSLKRPPNKEPDSLERLRDDMAAWNDLRMKTFCDEWIDRLTALIER